MERTVTSFSDNITSSRKFDWVSVLEHTDQLLLPNISKAVNDFVKKNKLIYNLIDLTSQELLQFERSGKLPPRVYNVQGLPAALQASAQTALQHWHDQVSVLSQALKSSFGVTLLPKTIEEEYASGKILGHVQAIVQESSVDTFRKKTQEVMGKIKACGSDETALKNLATELSQSLQMDIQPADLNLLKLPRIMEAWSKKQSEGLLRLVANLDMAKVSKEIRETLTLVTPQEIISFLEAEGRAHLHLKVQNRPIEEECEGIIRRVADPFRLDAFRAFCHFDPDTLPTSLLQTTNATLQDMLRGHATRRLDLFYLQARLLAGQESIVLRSPTVEQHGRGRRSDETQAAHSCLLPALQVLSKSAYEHHFSKIADWIRIGLPANIDFTKFKNRGRFFNDYLREMHSYLKSLGQQQPVTPERGRKKTVLSFDQPVDPVKTHREALTNLLLHEGFLRANGVSRQVIEKRVNQFFNQIEKELKSPEERLKAATDFTKEMIVLFLDTAAIADVDPLLSLKDSMNATVELPDYANQVCDGAIEREMRYMAERLLTQVSQNTLTPQEATQRLNQQLIRILDDIISEITQNPRIHNGLEILFVLKVYKDNSSKYTSQFDERHKLLDGLKI